MIEEDFGPGTGHLPLGESGSDAQSLKSGVRGRGMIKMAVEQLFGVRVESVNTCNVRGKLKRMGRNEGMTSSYKKAIVQLKESSKPIEYFNSLS